eukprot:g18726.t1
MAATTDGATTGRQRRRRPRGVVVRNVFHNQSEIVEFLVHLSGDFAPPKAVRRQTLLKREILPKDELSSAIRDSVAVGDIAGVAAVSAAEVLASVVPLLSFPESGPESVSSGAEQSAMLVARAARSSMWRGAGGSLFGGKPVLGVSDEEVERENSSSDGSSPAIWTAIKEIATRVEKNITFPTSMVDHVVSGAGTSWSQRTSTGVTIISDDPVELVQTELLHPFQAKHVFLYSGAGGGKAATNGEPVGIELKSPQLLLERLNVLHGGSSPPGSAGTASEETERTIAAVTEVLAESGQKKWSRAKKDYEIAAVLRGADEFVRRSVWQLLAEKDRESVFWLMDRECGGFAKVFAR